MDIKYKNNNFQFIYRVSSIIFNKDETKVLLSKIENRSFYMLPGGKVNEKEESLDAIKREIKEELGYENIDLSLFAISEEFVEDKGYFNQQINIIYKGIFKDEITSSKFKGLEGDWINFEWIDIKDIDNYRIYPSEIKDAIKDSKNIHHFIENLTK